MVEVIDHPLWTITYCRSLAAPFVDHYPMPLSIMSARRSVKGGMPHVACGLAGPVGARCREVMRTCLPPVSLLVATRSAVLLVAASTVDCRRLAGFGSWARQRHP